MPGVKGGVMEWNPKAVVIICLVAAILFYFFWPFNNSSSTSRMQSVVTYGNWKTKAFVSIPGDVLERKTQVKIEERRVAFEFEGQDFGIFMRESSGVPNNQNKVLTVLLLHGMAFTSKTWEDLGTLSLIAAMGHKAEAIDLPVFMLEAHPPVPKSDIPVLLLHGAGDSSDIWKHKVQSLEVVAAIGHRVVAIDLPRWGQSDKDKTIGNKGNFIARFLKHRGIERPVIVAPSMSGGYAIPYLMGSVPATCTDRARGFVPIAPVGTESYEHAEYHRCEVPTMIVYGTEDHTLGLTSLGNLRNMANSVREPMEKQGHACYIKKPDEWHHLLYNFLLAVEREQD